MLVSIGADLAIGLVVVFDPLSENDMPCGLRRYHRTTLFISAYQQQSLRLDVLISQQCIFQLENQIKKERGMLRGLYNRLDRKRSTTRYTVVPA